MASKIVLAACVLAFAAVVASEGLGYGHGGHGHQDYYVSCWFQLRCPTI